MNVLCAVDGSEYSHWGVEALRVLVDRPPERVVLLHTVEPRLPKSSGSPSPARVARVIRALDERGTTLLRQMAQVASVALGQGGTSAKTTIETALAHGRPATSIVVQARRRRATLVILGSRGLSDIRGFLLGSVSRHVLAEAPCSVLILKRPLSSLDQVVLAVDGSKHSRRACEFACQWLFQESIHVSVLSVAGDGLTEMASRVMPASQIQDLTRPQIDRAQELVSQYRDQVLKTGCSVTTEVRTGHTSEQILQHAERLKADLIIVGSRGLRGSERLELGSVAESVLKYAPCSVLVVKQRQPSTAS
ncbi:MAG: universal stress protein [Nitrospiraceae bacterium]